MPMPGARTVRLFVSSPNDVVAERQRVEVVAERLNGLYSGVVRIDVIRWETKFYTADKSIQPQIPEASDCDIVVGIFWSRLGTELPPSFPKMSDGTPYPSGTAYEILSAIQKREKQDAEGIHRGTSGVVHTDVYIFQKITPPFPAPKDENDLTLFAAQWSLLKAFFERWFRTRDGHFLAAFHSFGATDDFERQIERLLREWLAKHVLGTQALEWPITTMGSPFRGLKAFDAWHAPVFFGRSGDILRATERLKAAAREGESAAPTLEAAPDRASDEHKPACPYLLVVGASGAGKSSLVRAGIVPRLTVPGFVREIGRWRVATLRLDEQATPFDALAQALFAKGAESASEGPSPYTALPELANGDHATPDQLAALWRGGSLSTLPIERALDRAAIAEQVGGKLEQPPSIRLVLVVDQLDNLFASDLPALDCERFAGLLTNFSTTGRVWIVATLRAAFYERYLAETAFQTLRDGGATYDLAPPGRAELADIVRRPAKAAGLSFAKNAKGMSLDEEILGGAVDTDTLPLLQFALQALFERKRKTGDALELTFEAYEEIGGIDGAIDVAAEAALKDLSDTEKDALPRLLRQLVVAVGSSAAAAGRLTTAIQSVPFAAATVTPETKKLVEALIEARILTSEGDEQTATVRVIHQRAIESWQRAQAILTANTDFYRIRSEIEVRYQHWKNRGQKSELLLPAGLLLAEAESIVERFPGEIAPELVGYVERSGRHARQRQRLTAAAAVLFGAVALAAAFYWHQARNGLVAATNAIAALVQGISEVVRPLAQLDTVEELIAEARAAIHQFGGVPRDDGIRKQHARTFLLIADIQWDRGDMMSMRNDAQQALVLLSTLAENGDPENLLLRAHGRRLIGISHFENNERESARREYELGITDLTRLLDLNTDAALKSRAQRMLANLYQELGDVLLFKFYLMQEALVAFSRCLELRSALVEAGLKTPPHMHDLAWAANKHGDVHVRLDDDAAALKWFSHARTGLHDLGDHLWDNLTWAYHLSLIENNVGLIELRQNRFDDSIKAFAEAEKIILRVINYDPKNLRRRTSLSWTRFNRGQALFRSALVDKNVALLNEARAAFTASNKDTGIDAEQAPLAAGVQLGLMRGQAYLAAIDATLKEWKGDHEGAANGFHEAANILLKHYLPHVDVFPRRDYLSECIEYLVWAGNAHVVLGLPDVGRSLVEHALDLVVRYRPILGDKAFVPLQKEIEAALAKARLVK
jgi:tetratricopeptide (TPR) repeat protein